MSLTLSAINNASSEQLLHLIGRRHPEYEDQVDHWDFLELSYKGGREWIDKNIFTYHKEGKTEFAKRKQRAFRFPHSREVVSLVDKYVFKGAIERKKRLPQQIKEFWGSTTMLKRPIQDFMQSVSSASSTFGRVWVVVDNNLPETAVSEADRKAAKGRCYAYTLRPQQALDFEFDEDGELDWFLNSELVRTPGSPLEESGELKEQFRLWAKDFTASIKVTEQEGQKRAFVDKVVEHNLGLVPVFPADHISNDNLYNVAGLLEDVAYLDRAVANYLSNLDVIIQDQTFSQLAIPFQGLMPSGANDMLDPDDPDGEPDETDQMVRMGTKRIFAFNAEGGSEPRFISPDVKQANLIMAAITKIVGEIYHSIGMAGERTKEDNSAGIDNSSGVAKAYDFEKLNAMLAAKARSLENIERNLIRIVNAWHGEVAELEDTENYVSYPDTFDVRNLANEMDDAQRLSVMQAPKELRRAQMKRLAEKMFPQADAKELAKVLKEIEKDWLEEPDFEEVTPGEFPTTGRVPGKKNSQGENNKGSVKADDKEKEDA